MALIQCRECGEEVSDKANACPNCGDPNPMNAPPPPRDEKIDSCTECGAMVHENFDQCPNCGNSQSGGTGCLRIFLFLIFAIICFLIYGAIMDENSDDDVSGSVSEIVDVTSECYCSTSTEADEELGQALRREHDRKISELRLSGQVLTLYSGDRVKILDPGISQTTVQPQDRNTGSCIIANTCLP